MAVVGHIVSIKNNSPVGCYWHEQTDEIRYAEIDIPGYAGADCNNGQQKCLQKNLKVKDMISTTNGVSVNNTNVCLKKLHIVTTMANVQEVITIILLTHCSKNVLANQNVNLSPVNRV